MWPIGRFAASDEMISETVTTAARARVDTYKAVIAMAPVYPGSAVQLEDLPLFRFDQRGSNVKTYEIDLRFEPSHVFSLKLVAPSGSEITYTVQVLHTNEID